MSSLDLARSHRNRGIPMEPITSVVAPAYIDEMVHSMCGADMALHFPELGSATDVPKTVAVNRARVPTGGDGLMGGRA